MSSATITHTDTGSGGFGKFARRVSYKMGNRTQVLPKNSSTSVQQRVPVYQLKKENLEKFLREKFDGYKGFNFRIKVIDDWYTFYTPRELVPAETDDLLALRDSSW